MNIGVFLSQYDVAGKYTSVVETLARLIAEHEHTLVFGGTNEGLMHIIADGIHKGGGRIIAVSRAAVQERTYKNADEIILVEDSHAMNAGIIKRADVVVVLVGGIGTLNELSAVVRMTKNDEGGKRTVVVNTDGFYDGLKQQLQRMSDEGFLRNDVMKSIRFVDTPEDEMRYIEGHGN